MLQQLFVKNYAIIDQVTIRFSTGLNIITGETGAGKSILLGALGIVLGDRANSSTAFDKTKKCIVEAEFHVKNLDLEPFFKSHELDYDDLLILRRELLPSGRSRAFINDTPVKLQLLQALTAQLINVHRQFATLDIFNRSFQTKIIDAIAEQLDAVNTYQSLYRSWQKKKQERDNIQQKIREAAKENDFIQFQLNEIADLHLNPEQDDLIAEKLKAAEQQSDIQQKGQELIDLLKNNEIGAEEILAQALQVAIDLQKINNRFQDVTERIQSMCIELSDIATEVEIQQEGLSIDPEEFAELTQRHDQLQRLLFKHQLTSVHELEDFYNSLAQKISRQTQDEETLTALTIEIDKKEKVLIKQAKSISAKRKKHSKTLEDNIHAALGELAMNLARFSVQQVESDELNNYGMDDISFVFAANPGSDLKPLKQVASGGELSRLSLALKSIVAKQMALPTMVFDEIDSGVSGDTALRMGQMLRAFGDQHQTIVITHSAQVAAQGNAHYFVSKKASGDSTSTAIHKLTEDEREEKIAIMLSSDPPTSAARSNARDLLQLN